MKTTPWIANSKARDYVQQHLPFKGSNMWGEWYDVGIIFPGDSTSEIVRRYVVYSYRYTWPLFVYDPQVDAWYENRDEYSRTTKRHQSQAHPHTYNKDAKPTIKLCVDDMRIVAQQGAVGLIAKAQNDAERDAELAADVPF